MTFLNISKRRRKCCNCVFVKILGLQENRWQYSADWSQILTTLAHLVMREKLYMLIGFLTKEVNTETLTSSHYDPGTQCLYEFQVNVNLI